MKSAAKGPAVFLDRDGTVIRDVGYLHREQQLEILAGVPEAICDLRRRGFKIVVVTNQSGVARGRLTEEELIKINEILRQRLAQKGAMLDGIYYCPHHPTEGVGFYKALCDCRKPNIGLIRRASEELGIDPSVSYVVGDQESDMELAERAGATGILIAASGGERRNEPFETPRVADLQQAVDWILGQTGARKDRFS